MTTQEFLEELKRQKEKFRITMNSYGAIRFYSENDQYCFCPLTALCFINNGNFYETNEFDSAGTLLGISFEDSQAIAHAADTNDPAAKLKELRSQLLEVLDLKEDNNDNGS